jgi:hypothetical protein
VKYILDGDLAEETGMHVGDGSMNIYNGIYSYTLACHNIDDREFMDNYVIPLYKRIYGVKISPRMWSKGTYGFRLHNKEMVEFKHSLGLPYGKKDKISIPEHILNDDSFLKAFIRGFMATDGSVNNFLANKKTTYPRIQLSNVSVKLMKQLYVILKKFGFRVTVWISSHNYPRWNKSNRISINGYNQLKKWHDEIGFINPKQERKYSLLMQENNLFK